MSKEDFAEPFFYFLIIDLRDGDVLQYFHFAPLTISAVEPISF